MRNMTIPTIYSYSNKVYQEKGQLKYGPPHNWYGPPPPRGSEVFFGGIPRDCEVMDLVNVFQQVGPIYQLRLMMDFSGSNRGYGFVTFTHPDHAQAATISLNGLRWVNGSKMGVMMSVDNRKLFFGNIPSGMEAEMLKEELNKRSEGVIDVRVLKKGDFSYAFVEYCSHYAASQARRIFLPGKLELWGRKVTIDWAVPKRNQNHLDNSPNQFM